jgi:hypothetical protein
MMIQRCLHVACEPHGFLDLLKSARDRPGQNKGAEHQPVLSQQKPSPPRTFNIIARKREPVLDLSEVCPVSLWWFLVWSRVRVTGNGVQVKIEFRHVTGGAISPRARVLFLFIIFRVSEQSAGGGSRDFHCIARLNPHLHWLHVNLNLICSCTVTLSFSSRGHAEKKELATEPRN